MSRVVWARGTETVPRIRVAARLAVLALATAICLAGWSSAAGDTPSTRPDSADLYLTYEVDETTPNVGDTVQLAFSVRNQGDDDAVGVAVQVRLPSGFAYLDNNGSDNYDPVTGLWQPGIIPPGSEETLRVDARIQAVGEYVVTAKILRPAGEEISVPMSRRPLSVFTRAFGILGESIENGATPYHRGPMRFLLYVNNRAGAVSHVRLEDALDDGFRYVAGSMRYAVLEACELVTCSTAEEARIFETTAATGMRGTDATDHDVVSVTSEGLIGIGAVAGAVENRRLDIPARSVWALVYSARLEDWPQ